jgi:hypothetical protein
MTNDEILDLASDANSNSADVWVMTPQDMIEFARAIAAKEREACARLCDRLYRQETTHAQSYGGGYWYVTAKDCAKIIRTRGE